MSGVSPLLVRVTEQQENDEEEDEEQDASLTEALQLVVDKWFVDKGFGFGKVHSGEIVFIHASVVQGAEVLTIGTDAWVQVVSDDARGIEHAKPEDTPRERERDKERASRVAQRVRRAAALTAELAAQSERKVSAVCDHPPG